MKQYVKPDLFYEDFELSQHIAACSYKLGANENECSIVSDSYTDDYYDFVGAFTNSSVCTQGAPPVDSYCYTVGNSNQPNLFQS
ncbi:MAG: hypothetical protein ACI4OL_03650 [Gemmiger sp.]